MNEGAGQTQQQVQRFYDEVGWTKASGERYTDAARFDDLRAVSAEYRSKCHLRLNRYLAHQGRYLLDIASGPVQFPEYLTYSEGYDYHVCADLSITALQEARQKLGDHGLYVLCDINHLPFADDSIDALISLHTVYHVPAEQQLGAYTELHRVLHPSGQGVIVYSWSRYSWLMAVTLPYKAVVLVGRLLQKLLRSPSSEKEPQLYFHVHPPSWFHHQLKPLMTFDLVVWRSVNVQFLKLFIHEWLFGKKVLALIYWLEERLPKLLGKYGAYPIILIRK